MTRIDDTTVAMERLNYTLPEWTRIIWSSESVRQIWETKIQRASTVWHEVEERSVMYGERKSALIYVDDHMFLEKSKYYARQGLVMQPLTRSGVSNTYSASTAPAYDPSKPSTMRVVLTRPEYLVEWVEAWEKGDDRVIGKLLGFPECCIEFFKKIWVDERYLDTTWPMFRNSGSEQISKTNILLRWLGIRMVSHLPCSTGCQRTEQIANSNLDVMHRLGFGEAANDVLALLSLPMEWSAKHGIAEIKTPLFKISARTDATSNLYVARWQGSWYPTEAPSGTVFPYINTQKNLLTLSKSFKKSLEAVDVTLEWKDNGFSSKEVMDREHNRLYKYFTNHIGQVRSVADLGCGNGQLLHRLFWKGYAADCVGVEQVFEVAKRAQFQNPEFQIYNVKIDDFAAWKQDTQIDIGLISINRFTEWMGSHNVRVLAEKLLVNCKELVVYSYDKPLKESDYPYLKDLPVRIVE